MFMGVFSVVCIRPELSPPDQRYLLEANIFINQIIILIEFQVLRARFSTIGFWLDPIYQFLPPLSYVASIESDRSIRRSSYVHTYTFRKFIAVQYLG